MSSDNEHMRIYTRDRARRRATLLREMHGNQCKRCGAANQPLEFHHRDPTEKLFTIARRYSAPWSELIAEIAKCDLLCGVCHDDAHGFKQHGLSMYQHHGCRCEVCRGARRERNRTDYARRKASTIGGVA